MRGHEVRIGYFDQKLSELDEEHSLIDEIRTVRGDFNEDVARKFLGRFRFSGDDGFRKVKGLSGGERNRLALAKMMLRPRNLLALDEPTNHLDIPAARCWRRRSTTTRARSSSCRTIATSSIASSPRSCTSTTGAPRSTSATTATGSRARQKKPEPDKPAQKRDAGDAGDAATSSSASKSARSRRRRSASSAKKQKRLKELEEKIAGAESEVAALNEKLAADHGGDWTKLHAPRRRQGEDRAAPEVVDGRVGAARRRAAALI